MGTVYHQPLIVATTYKPEDLAIAREKAVEVFESETPRVEVDFNHIHGAVTVGPVYEGYNAASMFTVPSPGSKAGWPQHKDYETRVEEYVAWLRDATDWDKHYAKALAVEWLWVCFGGDGMAAVHHSPLHDSKPGWGAPWGFAFGKPLVARQDEELREAVPEEPKEPEEPAPRQNEPRRCWHLFDISGDDDCPRCVEEFNALRARLGASSK